MPALDVLCALCGSSGNKTVYIRGAVESEPKSLGAEMTTDVFGKYGRIAACVKCGFIFRTPRLAPQAILQAYAEMEDDYYFSQTDCRSINAHLSLQTIKRHVSNGRLLEIGCSAGFFLNAARLDFEPSGVEISKWAADHARKRLGLSVFNGVLREARFPSEFFDVVAMSDVIEHVENPKDMIKESARILKPGGLLYIVTPDIESASAKLFGKYWWGLRPAHLSYFSRKKMIELLESHGFNVVESRSYGRIFTYGYWLSRLKNYPAAIYTLFSFAVRLLSLEEKVVYINTRDSMEICARKSSGGH